MIQSLFLVLVPMLGVQATAPSSQLSATYEVAASSEYEALLVEFEAAEQQHIEALKQVEDRKQRAALRKQHPAFEFYPRFAELAAAGEGEAYLWLIPNARYCGASKAAERELQASQVRELFARHCKAPWFEEAVPLANKARKALGEQEHAALLLSVTECSELPEVQAAAGFALAQLLSRSKESGRQAEGLAWYEQVFTRWPDTRYGAMARPEFNRARFLRVGGEPLEFSAKTVEGEEFKLSDFRGKVVVLDFWGFW
jgi:hypothetical protein